MKVGYRSACLSAAVLATLYGTSAVQARDLQWDPGHTGTATGSDGSGTWNLTDNPWVDLASVGSNTVFLNGDSVTFGSNFTATGNGDNTVPNNEITLAADAAITVQNLTLGSAASGANHSIIDTGNSETLTVNGNIIKGGRRGTAFFGLSNALILSAGNHVIGAADSPTDDYPELLFSNAITGAGSITIDNTLNYSGIPADIQWGTTVFNKANSYTGGTTVQSGRLVVNNAGGLGSGGVVVQGAGALAFGGAKTVSGNLTINNAITISRSDYDTDITNNRYRAAVIASNDGTVNTITLPNLIINSTDARVQANTNTIVIPNPLTAGAIGTANAVFTADGDFAGFIQLTADNTPWGTAGGTIKIIGGVEVQVSSEANLGGPTSKLLLAGGTIKPGGALGASGSPFMTNFGAHNFGAQAINTGVNLDAGQVFTVNNLSGAAVGTRGQGTINFTGTNTFTGRPFFDAGTVNISGSTTFGGFGTRSSVMNIGLNTTVTSNANDIAIASDSPDNGTLNLTDNAILNQTNGGEFRVGGNGGTNGTVNISGTASLTTGGITFVGRGNNAVGTIVQNSGTLTSNRTGNFGFVLGDGRNAVNTVGTYQLKSGTFNSKGEAYVGEGGGGTGNWIQTGGTATVNDWFVVGREGGQGTFDINHGTFNKTGGGNAFVAEGNAATKTSFFNVHGDAIVNINNEFWVGQAGGKGRMTLGDTAQFTVGNWFALGRANGASDGQIDMSGGTFTKTGGGFIAVGSGGAGVFNQTGGTLTANGIRIAENSSGTMNISGGSATYTGEFSIGARDGAVGTLNISNTANVIAPAVVFGTSSINNAGNAGNGSGVLNLNGGTLTAGSFAAGPAGGAKTFNFNGGTLRAAGSSTGFITNTGGTNGTTVGTPITAVVRAGGAKIDTNTFNVTVAAPLLHESALGATADGGLTKSGAGMLTMTGANTYTGNTTVTGGTLQATSAAYAGIGTSKVLDVQAGKFVFDYSATTSPVSQVKSILDAGFNGNYTTSFQTGQIRSTNRAVTPADLTLGYGDDGTSKVTVMVTLPGDADLNGSVDFNDFLVLQNNYNQPNTTFGGGNFNYDGQTDFNDFLVLQNHFNQTITGASAGVSPAAYAYVMSITSSGAVPEPTTLGLIGLSAAGLLARRRKAVSVA